VLSELVGLRREIDSGEHSDGAAPQQAPAPDVQAAHLPATTHSIAVLPPKVAGSIPAAPI
jgi:hypothetical protein